MARQKQGRLTFRNTANYYPEFFINQDRLQENMPSSQIRPPTSELLELHVLYVPEDVWNFKLKTVPVDVISKFLSAGFIRVSPHLTLRTLRKHLGEYLGEDVIVDKFIFLKCIGKKLAVVKMKQETELKLKLFAPPYALHPELYLLPVEESIYSSLSTPERYHNNAEHVLTCTSHHRPHSLPAPNPEGQILPVFGSSLKDQFSQTQENVDFLGWNEGEKESPPVLHIKQSSEQENNERIQEKSSSQRKKGETHHKTSKSESIALPFTQHDLNPARQNSEKKMASAKMHQSKSHSHVQEKLNNSRKEEPSNMLDSGAKNGVSIPGDGMWRHPTGDSGIPEPLEDRDLEYLYSKSHQYHQIANSAAGTDSALDHQTDKNVLSDLANPGQYLSPPTPPLLAVSINKAAVANKPFPIEGNELNIQLQHIKAERKHLEETREELVKKVKSLLEQNKFKRYYARDSWKKKYFEAKKVTFSLEEVLNKLRKDLELHYQKLLVQLQARDIRKKRNNLTHNINSKNNTIIQITTLQHEIDQLRRKLDHAKMKLIIEIKMRKQATFDLQTLKAELAHKKVQSSLKLQSEK